MVGVRPQPTDSPEHQRTLLVQRVAARVDGSDAALEQLYRAFQEPVYGLALRILRDEKAAEEATVEVFVRVWDRAATFDPERGKVLAWVLTMARSAALEALRARRREGARARLEDLDPEAGGPGPAVTVQEGETSRRVADALKALPKEQERLLRAAFFGGLSYREVAEVFGQPLGTVKTRIRAGLAALRRSLAPEGEWA